MYLYSGNVNETDLEVTSYRNTTEALVDTTTTADVTTTTSRPTPETTTLILPREQQAAYQLSLA